ncbi:MAG: hypothetical protein Kow0077_08990 [Anaerolineae bacterium]
MSEQETPSVSVEPLLGYPALLVTWQYQIVPEEMAAAFQTIREIFDSVDRKMFVVMDLTNNPQLEVLEVVTHATPVFKHPRSAKWLFVGQSGLGRVVESKLISLTRRDSAVIWFDTLDEAFDYLQVLDSTSSYRSE